ncbi:MAG TPA: UDP-N-acetylglucosamine 2-epimerase (non-hydrolyzing) [Candidatus Methanofastidiosa archaeon]|nr:UDP-N-acetylglucosamine 2-epimerase (non-hydrolyzing) [Candidatus Methanofastidiosa archaeon]
MSIAVILGTRPEIIKFSPIIRELEERGIAYYTIHTGQHYSFEMDRIFFEELELPVPKYHLNVGSGEHGEQTGKMLTGIEGIFKRNMPLCSLVQGDTNTVLAGSIVTSKMPVKLGHVEAGLRSFDRSMPEEVNRIVSDHLSDLLFAPTDVSRNYLLKEGIPEEKIYITGNTVVDAAYQNLEISKRSTDIEGIVKDEEYALVTAHRQENVDNADRLSNILSALGTVHRENGMPVIFPAHPRTVKMMKSFGLEAPEGVRVIKPVGYLEFLQLEGNASVVITDSGGVQEEACILKVPCVTIRENTERPETIDAGSNILAGTDPDRIARSVSMMIERKRDWKNPYGEGITANMIVEIIDDILF